MAIAKKCDICGKFYEHYGEKYEPRTCNSDTVNPNSIEIVYSSETYPLCDEFGQSSVYTWRHYDLCPECLEKVLNFIESLKGGMNNAD